MPKNEIDLWWAVGLGTSIILSLVLGIFTLILLHERVKHKHQKDKVSLIEADEAKYADLFNNVSDIVYLHSLSGVIQQINDTAMRLLGYSREEMKGSAIFQYVRSTYHPKVVEYLTTVIQTTGDVVGILPVISKTDHRLCLLEYRSSVVKENGEPVAVRGIARDATQRIMDERALRKAERRMTRLLRQSQIMQQNLARLSQGMLKMQEDDRSFISRELHDEVGQVLTAISLSLETVRADLSANPDAARDKITATQSLIEDVYDRVHKVLHELRAVSLDSRGLMAIVKPYIKQFSERTGIRVDLSADGDVELLTQDQKIVLYRVIQEALTNVARHARAKNAAVVIMRNGAHILARIEDNGTGFVYRPGEPIQGAGSPPLGILGMQERVKLVQGEFSLLSELSRGTTISVTMSVPKNGVSEITQA